MKHSIVLALIICTTPALADGPAPPPIEPPATVTLTQQELTQIVQAEVQAALAADHARQAAADAYAKVQGAFMPKKEH